MRYIPNDSTDPAYNQAFEQCAFELPTDEELLLVWRNRPAVVCGRYQNIFQEVHLPSAREAGVETIRRMTGGGCVYHDLGNVNYALIGAYCENGYDKPLEKLLGALQALGLNAGRGAGSSVLLDGGKISGSAQRISRGRMLHHGTLLFDTDLNALRKFANGHSACYSSKAIQSVPAPVTNIRAHWQQSMTAEQFADALAQAFAPDDILEMPEAQREQAALIAQEKYRAWSWTYAHSPQFQFSRTGRFLDVPIQVEYAAAQAVIQSIRIECGALDGARLAGRLTGARLCWDELAQRVYPILRNEAQATELLQCLF